MNGDDAENVTGGLGDEKDDQVVKSGLPSLDIESRRKLSHDRARNWLAVVLLSMMPVAFVAYFAGVYALANNPPALEALKSGFTQFMTAISALTGSAVAFYFARENLPK